jgi:aromatic-amino-acid transaminase
MLDNLASVPLDPVMHAAQIFEADTRPNKINLGIGVYYDNNGRIPVLNAVREASSLLRDRARPWSYLLTDGLHGLRESALRIAFGDDLSERIKEQAAVFHTPGGTGAVRLGAEIVKAVARDAKIAISRPSWPNHEAIFRSVGLEVSNYDYFDAVSGMLSFDGMMKDLEGLPGGSVVVLHACCHNPTGSDPTPEQWAQIADLMSRRSLIPFLDMAYQGFGRA